MTVRKIWLLLLMSVAVIAISINAVVISVLTNRYFSDYRNENYNTHLNEITSYVQNALQNEDLSLSQMEMELETHLDDPIIQIKLYDAKGNLLIDIENTPRMMGGMMSMMKHSYDEEDSEVDTIQLLDGKSMIGQLNIVRYSSLENSIVSRNFTKSLFINSLYSIGGVLIIALLIGVIISRKMSKDLRETAMMAQDISLGSNINYSDTGISEIKTIRLSLVELNNKLRLKNKSRKVLIDELIHQTRTPLTVLKTHLEGVSDNILKITPKEIKVCENQIDDITAIISNMSNLIDAGKEVKELQIEEFEISSVLKQIINGLSAQFSKKSINLKFFEKEKIVIKSDRYKLSQIVYNLLTNAYKYTGENGSVALKYEQQKNTIVIRVEDTGIGISELDIPHIFEAYYQSNENSAFHGDGLGLYLVKQNVIQMGGEITVESIKGQGSKFIITLSL